MAKPRAPNAPGETTRTTLNVHNLHCQACVTCIVNILTLSSPLQRQKDLDDEKPAIFDIDISLPDRTISFTHFNGLDLEGVLKELQVSGFEVEMAGSLTPEPAPLRWRWRSFLTRFTRREDVLSQREASHRKICDACRSSDTLSEGNGNVPTVGESQALRESRISLKGMTCSSSTLAISDALSPSSKAGIRSSEVSLLPPSALVVHDVNILPVNNIRSLIEGNGIGAELISSKEIPTSTESMHAAGNSEPDSTTYKAVLSIIGMTCASCVSSVTQAIDSVPGTTAASVDLIGKVGSVVVQRKEDAELVKNEIEDVGFECSVVEILEHHNKNAAASVSRTVNIRVDGMREGSCVEKVNNAFEDLSRDHTFTFDPITLDHPTTTMTYSPLPPSFTLRLVRDEIGALGFTLSIVHVDGVEERAARARTRELRYILLRLMVTFLFAIPTFIVAVVGMSLLKTNNAFRANLEMPVWGNASRGTVILFALATPVQIWVGWFFYARAWKSLKGVWRTRKAGADWGRVWLERLFRWGSMDTLVSLGTVTGYLASLALMVLDIRTVPIPGTMGGQMGWFDSSVFLMFFILAGRSLEAISKRHTGDAIATLSATKPSTGLLYSSVDSSTTVEQVNFLEVGDTLIVPAGASPPLDAVLAPSSATTTFDESSLTGEARPVLKAPGDEVFAGTTNAGPAAAVVTVTNEVGKTMLDGIVGVVREAMGKKAGIARLADTVTGYFVPAVVGIAALTFGVWCLRGYLGELPPEWANDQRRGGWALFAVQFGVAVLVVACPCGIGLAAPTAQMVGVGLAAQHGILSNGGGEAFQTISAMNTVVLDKTGTLTTSKFTVSDHKVFVQDSSRSFIFALLRAAEHASTHPLAVGVREWCQAQLADNVAESVNLVSSEEIPGRGLRAVLIANGAKIEVAIGNEKLMQDVNAEYPSEPVAQHSKGDLLTWQMAGKSVILLSAKLVAESSSATLELPVTSDCHSILGVFGVHDPPRPEASTLVAELRRLDMDVWMISGDNQITAQTVAESVGIDKSHVVAGALPADKQSWVKRLQNGEERSRDVRSKSRWNSRPTGRTVVAFCGDGINDAPAIAQADVGLAMGGGSNVAVSTADFCLLNSNLLSILTIHHLSRATRNKIISNFAWACFYNVTLMPLAAGAFYPLGRTTLPPVWASAAMAFSSVSVVTNSLFLRWLYNPPKVVRTWNHGNTV